MYNLVFPGPLLCARVEEESQSVNNPSGAGVLLNEWVSSGALEAVVASTCTIVSLYCEKYALLSKGGACETGWSNHFEMAGRFEN